MSEHGVSDDGVAVVELGAGAGLGPQLRGGKAATLADHLPTGNAQRLLSGLPDVDVSTPPHAVQSIDWYHPTAAELGWVTPPTPADPQSRREPLVARRRELETACQAALHTSPRLSRRFAGLLAALEHTSGPERAAGPEPHTDPDLRATVARRRATWQQQRRLPAPLTVGTTERLAERALTAAVTAARAGADIAHDALVVGHSASPGRATGPMHLITSPSDFPSFRSGEVLLARATAPAWTPLFAHAAVITDAGTLAAHACLIAREYGIPAVVGTGNATTILQTGQWVTVDGSTGVVHPHAPTTTDPQTTP